MFLNSHHIYIQATKVRLETQENFHPTPNIDHSHTHTSCRFLVIRQMVEQVSSHYQNNYQYYTTMPIVAISCSCLYSVLTDNVGWMVSETLEYLFLTLCAHSPEGYSYRIRLQNGPIMLGFFSIVLYYAFSYALTSLLYIMPAQSSKA